jgi:carboxylesterase type B
MGSEHCLFLSVIAPPGAKDLPVLFYIHGGGYGEGSGNYDFTGMMNNNDNGFIYAGIQF